MIRLFRKLIGVLFPVQSLIAKKTSYIWFFVSMIGLTTFTSPDNGYDIVVRATDGLPTSKLLTNLMLPFNSMLYDVQHYFETLTAAGKGLKLLKYIASEYAALQVAGLRIFLMACIRFSGVMFLAFILSYYRMKKRNERAATMGRSSWLPLEDQMPGRKSRYTQRAVLAPSRSVVPPAAYTIEEKPETSAVTECSSSEDELYKADYANWYKDTPYIPGEAETNRRKVENPYHKKNNHVGMFKNDY